MKIKKTLIAIFLMSFGFSSHAQANNLASIKSSPDNINAIEINNSHIIAIRRHGKLPIPIQSNRNRIRAFISQSGFKPRKVKMGSTLFTLGINDMRHVLTRHHPKFWKGESKGTQTFFNANMTAGEISEAIFTVAKQNRQKLGKIGGGSGKVEGVFKGLSYVLGVEKGRFHQFYPKIK
jgi:hypothetical protein